MQSSTKDNLNMKGIKEKVIPTRKNKKKKTKRKQTFKLLTCASLNFIQWYCSWQIFSVKKYTVSERRKNNDDYNDDEDDEKDQNHKI